MVAEQVSQEPSVFSSALLERAVMNIDWFADVAPINEVTISGWEAKVVSDGYETAWPDLDQPPLSNPSDPVAKEFLFTGSDLETDYVERAAVESANGHLPPGT